MRRNGLSTSDATLREIRPRWGCRTQRPPDHLAAVAAGLALQALAKSIKRVSCLWVVESIQYHLHVRLYRPAAGRTDLLLRRSVQAEELMLSPNPPKG